MPANTAAREPADHHLSRGAFRIKMVGRLDFFLDIISYQRYESFYGFGEKTNFGN